MRVLHLPYNIASQISVTVRALIDIGIDARGLVLDNAIIQDDRCVECYSKPSRRKSPIQRTIQRLSWHQAVLKAIHWADVVHWRWGRVNRMTKWPVRYLGFLNKPCLIDFCGSDIRIAENACQGNPFLSRAMEREGEPSNQFQLLSQAESLARQAFFSRCGFQCVIRKPELHLSIEKRYFPSPYWIMSPLMLSDFQPVYPPPGKRKPLILHFYSKKRGIKGTTYLLQIMQKLKDTHDFDFQLVGGLPHLEALEMIRNCDILLDQFLLGDYGIVATEAMAMGKPTVCWIRPEVGERLPPQLPIVNANLDNLANALGRLIEDGGYRYEIGLRSREFVEKYHDGCKVAKKLVGIYQELLQKA